MVKDNNGLEGKYIFVRLKGGHVYSGLVKSHNDSLIKIIDKFGAWVYIFEHDIEFLKEEKR